MAKKEKNGFGLPGLGCAILFGLPFAAVSIFMLWSRVSMLGLASASKNWVETQATITQLELESGENQKVTGNCRYVFERWNLLMLS